MHYLSEVLKLRYVVGWHWCGFIDRLESNEAPFQHPGLKNIYDEPYVETLTTIMEANQKAYAYARQSDGEKRSTL